MRSSLDVLFRPRAVAVIGPAIAELDVNPLFAGQPGSPTAAADARITLQDAK